MAGIGNATKYGILIKEGDALERLSEVRKIAFDKTGTLTYGRPKITKVTSFDESTSEEQLLKLIASVEKSSEHPLGKAIVEHFNSVSKLQLEDITDFRMVIGKGVYGTINNIKFLAGNDRLLKENNIALTSSQKDKVKAFRSKGCTIIFLAENSIIKGFIVLEDVLRKNSKEMVEGLKKLGKDTVLLTGDNKQTASNIALESGIDEFYSECLPEDKLSIIDKFQSKDERVCMVGDGVNDAPALKKSFVGIAMGGIGSDIAVEAADIALIGDDIKALPHLMELSKRTMRTININIIISMILNFVAIILAMTGVLNPIVGALVHNIGSVVVIVHSALLLKWKS
jgi:heavy metal translocating P-type ATPase